MTSPITSLQDIIDGLANEIPLKRALRDQILTEELLHLPV